MISFRDLSFSYRGSLEPALDHVQLEIPLGSLFALLGPNGAGKTTLLRILCGRLAGYAGRLDVPSQWLNPQRILDPRLYGVLIENPGVYGRLSVREYLQFFASFYAIDGIEARIDKLTERLGMENLAQRMSSLSLGMRQKVQIMRAFLHRAPLILLDEPSSNLDPLAREEVWNLVRETNREEGTTFILCSHVLAEMERHATHLGVIRKGKVVAAGTLSSIRTRYTQMVQVSIHFSSAVSDHLDVLALTHHVLPTGAYLQSDARTLRYECFNPDQVNPLVISALVQHGIPLREVCVHYADLGEIYRQLVS